MKKQLLALLFCICMLLCIPQAGAAVTMLGDVNCDGQITAADASLLLRYFAGLAPEGISKQGLENADANSDGKLDPTDAAMILRHLVKLVNLNDLSPTPSATASPVPSESASPTASPTPPPSQQPDQALLKLIQKGCAKGSNQYHDWTVYAEDITLFIQSLPKSNPYRAILYAGATHMGKPYGTGNGQLDCSGFVRETYRDCGYEADVYPGGSSDSVIQWFRTFQPKRIHNVVIRNDIIDTTGWKPGYVLGYLDASGTGNHVSIYIGCIDGIDFVMESSTSRNGVCIRRVWTDTKWQLKYYMNPLD